MQHAFRPTHNINKLVRGPACWSASHEASRNPQEEQSHNIPQLFFRLEQKIESLPKGGKTNKISQKFESAKMKNRRRRGSNMKFSKRRSWIDLHARIDEKYGKYVNTAWLHDISEWLEASSFPAQYPLCCFFHLIIPLFFSLLVDQSPLTLENGVGGRLSSITETESWCFLQSEIDEEPHPLPPSPFALSPFLEITKTATGIKREVMAEWWACMGHRFSPSIFTVKKEQWPT